MKFLIATSFLLALFGCGTESPSHSNTDIASLKGQWVIVNYWAEWCKPCIEEIPELNELDKNHATISVLGVNYDGARGDDLQRQIDALGIHFPILGEDPAAALGVDRPSVLPTTFVLNPSGIVTEILVGPQTASSLLAATGQ